MSFFKNMSVPKSFSRLTYVWHSSFSFGWKCLTKEVCTGRKYSLAPLFFSVREILVKFLQPHLAKKSQLTFSLLKILGEKQSAQNMRYSRQILTTCPKKNLCFRAIVTFHLQRKSGVSRLFKGPTDRLANSSRQSERDIFFYAPPENKTCGKAKKEIFCLFFSSVSPFPVYSSSRKSRAKKRDGEGAGDQSFGHLRGRKRKKWDGMWERMGCEFHLSMSRAWMPPFDFLLFLLRFVEGGESITLIDKKQWVRTDWKVKSHSALFSRLRHGWIYMGNCFLYALQPYLELFERGFFYFCLVRLSTCISSVLYHCMLCTFFGANILGARFT